MELKPYTPACPKIVFEKLKFKVLHYIEYDFIYQRPGLCKDQISMFKKSCYLREIFLLYRIGVANGFLTLSFL